MTAGNVDREMALADFPSQGEGYFRTKEGITWDFGTTVPAAATEGYAPGAVFIHTDGSAANLLWYVNIGTKASSNFVPATTIVPSQRVRDLTAATTLTIADHGKIILLNSATEFAVTLPAVADAVGMELDVFVKAAPSSASYTVTTGNTLEDKMIGHVLTNDFSGVTDSDFEASGGDTLTFVDSKAVKGDRAKLICDGEFWHVTAFCSVFDAITITGT